VVPAVKELVRSRLLKYLLLARRTTEALRMSSVINELEDGEVLHSWEPVNPKISGLCFGKLVDRTRCPSLSSSHWAIPHGDKQ